MSTENWLVQYQSIEGLRYILEKMDSRTKYASKMQYATEELEIYYEDFQAEFTLFFEDIQAHVKSFRATKNYWLLVFCFFGILLLSLMTYPFFLPSFCSIKVT